MSAMVKRLSFFFLALILCFALIGCAEKQEAPTPQQIEEEEALTPQQIDQIITEAASAAAEIGTCITDMITSGTLEVTGGGETATMTTVADLTIATDNVNKKMHILQTMTNIMPGGGKQETRTETYFVGDWKYVKAPETGGQWTKMKSTREMWETQDQIAQQIEFLQTAAEVSFIGSEAVDSIDCYVFKIIPDMNKIAEYMSQQPEMQGLGPEGIEYLKKLFEKMSVSMKQWIAKDTCLFTKAELHLLMEMTPEDVGATKDEFERMSADYNTVIDCDYNQPVSIELPPEALDAPEMSAVTPTEYNTYSSYGFSFRYPKHMSLAEEGHPMFGGEASETSGWLLGRRDNGDHEILWLGWFEAAEGGAGMLEGGLAGLRENIKQGESYTELVIGDIIESELCGHRMIYQTFAYKLDGDQVYEVAGTWYCDRSQRFWQLMVLYSEEDVSPVFQRYVDSFVCH